MCAMILATPWRTSLFAPHERSDEARAKFALSASQWIEAQDNVSLL